MKNKTLNIIGILAVIVAAFFAVQKYKGNKIMQEQIGNFNLNALENAVEKVKQSVEKTRAGVEQIVAFPNKTYMNFVRALQDNSNELHEITYPIYHLNAVMHSEETEKIINEILPILSNFSSDMARHKGIYQGFLEIKKSEYENLTDEQKKVIDDSIRDFKIAGIDLPPEKQERLKQINVKLSKLSQDFSNNVIAANKKFSIKITDEKLLGDMPQSDKDANKIKDGWEFSLLAPSYIPFMTYVLNRDLRSKMHRAYMTRAPENEKLIPQILSLHQNIAKILGYKNYAELAFENRSAPNPKEVKDFLQRIADTARPQALKELEELKLRAAKDGIKDFSPWDNLYYSNKILKEKYNLDENETKPYFEANATTKRIFNLLEEMFDIKFIERKVPLWHQTANYFDVKKDGKIIGGFYVDLQTRQEKQSGAWENGFHTRHLNSQNEICLPEVV
ncbi:MAG: M3 family metallopeptidase, partial [Alphaproteobacteria bacterium]|nr:M3 family metallopeptidase [Alphaproteobacteria bacterium]